MKVLHFGKYYPPFFGGVEKVNYDLVENLNKYEDCHVDELCFAHTPDFKESLKKEYNIFRIPIRCIKFSTPIPKGLIGVYKKIRDNYDIIHLHAPNPIAMLIMLLFPTKAKIVVHWHSDIIKQKKLLLLFNPIQNLFLRKASAIIATSNNYAENSSCLHNFRDKVFICPIGLDKKEMIYRQDDVDIIKSKYQGKRIVLSIGRMTSYKGHKYLIEAAKSLDENTIVLLGGVGELEDQLKEMVSVNHLEEKVMFLGRIPQNLIYAYYQAADVFCLPSITKAEAFGVVLIEALAMGTPVVTCNIEGSGVPWVNENGVTGFNVPVEDALSLSSRLNELLGNPKLLARFSENGRKRFEENFTLNKMVDKTYQIYSSL